MADVFKVVGELFGIVTDDSSAQNVKPQYVDPAAERRALAELKSSGILQDSEPVDPQSLRESGSAIAKDGTVDFAQVFALAGIRSPAFTADQAVILLANVEKTIPAVFGDVQERNNLLRNVITASMTGDATTSTVAADAKAKSDVLRALVRSRLDTAADFKLKTTDKIKSLERQIAAAKAAIDATDSQFSAISSNCKARQALYARIVELLTEQTNETKTP